MSRGSGASYQVGMEEFLPAQWEQRVWGYTGAGGMVQAFAAGYFLWDLGVCLRNFRMFGVGLLAHAVAALVVFSFGFVSATVCPAFSRLGL